MTDDMFKKTLESIDSSGWEKQAAFRRGEKVACDLCLKPLGWLHRVVLDAPTDRAEDARTLCVCATCYEERRRC
jgi:hypothetical protein